MKSIIIAFLLLSLLSCRSKMPLPAPPEVPEETVEETTITPENVMAASVFLPGDENKDFNDIYRNNDSILASHFKIEFIDMALFDSQQQTAVNFWTEDPQGVTKTDSLLTVRARDTTLTFTDNITETETYAHYTYEGQFPVINQYVVLGTLYEEYGYMLIDKTTGRNTATFPDFPLISPDKRTIVSVHANIYDPKSGDIELNRFENGMIVPVLSASFTNWMPQISFYGSDGYLYISVNHPKTYWAPDGEVNDEHQYIRIKTM